MATFPHDITVESGAARQSFVRGSRAVDGTLRYIDLGATAWFELQAETVPLTAAQRDSLMAWIATNETSEIDFNVGGGTTYRGRLVPGEPVEWSVEDAGLYVVSLTAWVRPI